MKDLILSVFNIFRYCGKGFTVIRNTLVNVVLLILIIAVIASFVPDTKSPISDDSILKLDIAGDIVEEKRALSSFENFLATSMQTGKPDPETALQDILDVINSSASDDRITVLLLNLKYMGKAGLNQLYTIGEALENFKKSGKKVIAAEDYYSQSQYFLASHANSVIVNPMGGVDLHGFGVYKLYFRKALDKLAINYNIFRVGTFKAAVEPLIRDDMSPEDRLQNELWLNALWDIYTESIVKLRKIQPEAITYYTNNIAKALQGTDGNPAKLAYETGLVDHIFTRMEITDYLSSLTKQPSEPTKFISSKVYFDSLTPSYSLVDTETAKIGLIVAEGNILPGKQPPGLIGGDSLASLIRKARNDEQVKALVLRISSGGGSAFASEIIRQELLELKKSGKPLVVSMGSVAASGGYWIAADADQIWASQASITGSIGVFGAIPTFEKLLDSIGVYSDGVGTTPLAAGINLTQDLPDQLKTAIQQTVAFNYNQFLSIVAEGRNIDKAKVAEIAEGRVYDGQTAQNLGLVDELGDLQDAIGAAAGLAELDDFKTEYIRLPLSTKEQFLHFLATQAGSIEASLGLSHPALTQIKNKLKTHLNQTLLLDDPKGIYAHSLINFTL